MRDHVHRLLVCPDCNGDLSYESNDGYVWCDYCDRRGYFEICEICREPMGNLRRRWKAAGRPTPWTEWAYRDRNSADASTDVT